MRDDLFHPPTKGQGVPISKTAKRYARIEGGAKWLKAGNGGTPKQKLYTKVNAAMTNPGVANKFATKDVSATTSGKKLVDALLS